MRKMFVAGHIEKHQYDAANEIQSLQERYDKAGMRTNGIPELIDGGKAPDVRGSRVRRGEVPLV